MKKTLSLLLVLLLVAAALPALASPSGASPEDIAIWETKIPAPAGEFQKIIDVVGPEKAKAVIGKRIAESQTEAVYVTIAVVAPDGTVTYETISVEALFAMISGGTYLWSSYTDIMKGEFFTDARDPQFRYYFYNGEGALFSGDPNAQNALIAASMELTGDLRIHSWAEQQAGLLNPGDLYRDATGMLYAQGGLAGKPVEEMFNNIMDTAPSAP